jgi:hypothetical protein
MLQKEIISERDRPILGYSDSHEHNFQDENGELLIKIFMDYCYFIEKLWLDWKHSYLRLFTPNEKQLNQI